MDIIHWLFLISHNPQLLCLLNLSLSCPALCTSFYTFYCSEKADTCNIIKDKGDGILSDHGTGFSHKYISAQDTVLYQKVIKGKLLCFLLQQSAKS